MRRSFFDLRTQIIEAILEGRAAPAESAPRGHVGVRALDDTVATCEGPRIPVEKFLPDPTLPFLNSRRTFVRQVRKRLTYSNVMSSLAVFMVLGGGAAIAANLPKKSVGTAQLKPNAVKTGKIAKEAVKAGKLANEAINAAKLGNNAVLTGKLADLAVTSAKLANDAVTTAKIANDAVTTAKIANDAVATEKIANDAVTTAKIANDAVATEKIANSAVANAKLTDAAVSSTKLANGAVTGTKIASAAVTSQQLGGITFRGESTPIAAESIGLASAGCNAGEQLLSIGYLWDAQNKLLTIQDSFAFISGGFVRGYNGTNAVRNLTVQVACLAA